MDPDHGNRKLTTIVAGDVVGYSRLMMADEDGTLSRLKSNLDGLIEPAAAQHGGRIVKLMGDGLLMEFASVSRAVAFAREVQCELVRRSAGEPDQRRIRYRIGINVGDVIVDGTDVFGTGVNVAARLEGLCPPDGIAISDQALRLAGGGEGADWQGGDRVAIKNIEGGVRVWFWKPQRETPGPPQTADASGGTAPRKKPSILVLPFLCYSADPDLAFFGDGLVENLMTNLQRFRLLSVISATSAFRYRQTAMNLRDIARESGADYVLEGGLRRAGNMVRVSAQLIEAGTDGHLWAERYDRSFDDPFRTQDDVTAAITASIEPVLVEAINRRGGARGVGDEEVDPVRRAGWRLSRFTRADNARAIELLEAAIRENPNADRRYQALAIGHLWDLTFLWTSDGAASARRALNAAETAVSISDKDAWNYAVLAWAQFYAGKPALARASVLRAIELNPNSGVPHCVHAWIAGHLLDCDTAIAEFRRSVELAPNNPFAFQYRIGASLGHYGKAEFRQALELAESAILRRPNSVMARVLRAACLEHLGQRDPASGEVRALIELGSDCRPERLRRLLPVQDGRVLDDIIDCLVKSGLPA